MKYNLPIFSSTQRVMFIDINADVNDINIVNTEVQQIVQEIKAKKGSLNAETFLFDFIGKLRVNKPDWHIDICTNSNILQPIFFGKLVMEDTAANAEPIEVETQPSEKKVVKRGRHTKEQVQEIQPIFDPIGRVEPITKEPKITNVANTTARPVFEETEKLTEKQTVDVVETEDLEDINETIKTPLNAVDTLIFEQQDFEGAVIGKNVTMAYEDEEPLISICKRLRAK